MNTYFLNIFRFKMLSNYDIIKGKMEAMTRNVRLYHYLVNIFIKERLRLTCNEEAFKQEMNVCTTTSSISVEDSFSQFNLFYPPQQSGRSYVCLIMGITPKLSECNIYGN